jgi:hypothetical protein
VSTLQALHTSRDSAGSMIERTTPRSLPLEAFLGQPVNALIPAREAMPGHHQPGARQLTVGFPVSFYVYRPALLGVQTE